MKWIKLFEAFDKSDYYREIKPPIEESIPQNVDMSKEMADKIENLFMGTNIDIEYGEYPGPGPDSRMEESEFWAIELKPLNDEGKQTATLIINELYDEWFSVEMFSYLTGEEGGFWVCDQFEGLVMLLKDKGVLR
jgi:hypothetical protein